MQEGMGLHFWGMAVEVYFLIDNFILLFWQQEYSIIRLKPLHQGNTNFVELVSSQLYGKDGLL